MRLALPLIVSLICLWLGGCGQKGPLFIPSEESAPQSSAQPKANTQPKLQPQPELQPGPPTAPASSR